MILTALCLALSPALSGPASTSAPALAPDVTPDVTPPTLLEPASPDLLLARLPRRDAQGREQFIGSGAAPGGRLLLVMGPPTTADGVVPAGNLSIVSRELWPLDVRWLLADGSGQVAFQLPQAEGLRVQLWRAGSASLSRARSRSLPLARRLSANYSGPPAVISEFMKDPTDVTDTHGEWVEITNLNPWRLRIEGWVLSDDGGNHALLGGGPEILRCGPGESIVIGRDADPMTNGGVPVLGEWTGFTLSNGADEIILSTPDGVVVDRVAYDDGVLWPESPGQSLALDPAALDVTLNDDPANWCLSQTVWNGGSTDTGTPNAPNTSCP